MTTTTAATNGKRAPTKIKGFGGGITRAVLPNGLSVIAKEMHGALVKAYDPVAMENTGKLLQNVHLCEDA